MKQAISYRQVVRVLNTLEKPEYAQWAIRRFTGDKNRWNAKDQALMADALSHTEDLIELDRPRYNRSAIRAIRRLLENEIL